MKSFRLSNHIDYRHLALERIALDQAEVVGAVVDVEGNVPCPMLRFAVGEVAQMTYVENSTSPGKDGSWPDMNLDYMRKSSQTQTGCYREFAAGILEDRYFQEELETGSWVRSTSLRLYRMNEMSFRSGLTSPKNQGNQPGETMYRRSMPVAAVAKAEKATYHSHTAVAERRDGYSMVRQKVPGFALAIATGDPASRFEESRPKGQQDRLNEGRSESVTTQVYCVQLEMLLGAVGNFG